MLVRSRCRKCSKTASFTAGSVAGIFGNGREIRSVKFRCKDCNGTDCEVPPYEDTFERKAKPQAVKGNRGIMTAIRGTRSTGASKLFVVST